MTLRVSLLPRQRRLEIHGVLRGIRYSRWRHYVDGSGVNVRKMVGNDLGLVRFEQLNIYCS